MRARLIRVCLEIEHRMAVRRLSRPTLALQSNPATNVAVRASLCVLGLLLLSSCGRILAPKADDYVRYRWENGTWEQHQDGRYFFNGKDMEFIE